MTTYVAILKDRHIDDTILAFSTIKRAEAQIIEWMESYGARYEWEHPVVNGWFSYTRATNDDGPKMHIEKLEVDA